MHETATPLGTLRIAPREDIFKALAAEMEEALPRAGSKACSIALTGGSTPLAFYKWAVEEKVLSKELCQRANWFTSDERYVALESEESNFGNADRLLLQPLQVDELRKHPWPVHVDPHSAVAVFNRQWGERFGGHRCFDLCLLGMGDDGHTASLFPQSPMIGSGIVENFVEVEVPGKGWRFTITEAGLGRCGRIVLVVTGAGKAARLQQILEGPLDIHEQPVQLLHFCKDRVLLLADEEAAAQLKG